MLEVGAAGRVVFAPDGAPAGVLLTGIPWDRDGWPHVLWDGDDYWCVLRPEEVRPESV